MKGQEIENTRTPKKHQSKPLNIQIPDALAAVPLAVTHKQHSLNEFKPKKTGQCALRLTSPTTADQLKQQSPNSSSSSSSSSSSASTRSSSSVVTKQEVKDHEHVKNTCQICDKSFKTQNILRQHLRIHTGDKPFVCTICSKAFSQMASLKYHLATHSDERPYCCEYCSKTFKLKPPFKKHVRECRAKYETTAVSTTSVLASKTTYDDDDDDDDDDEDEYN